MSEMKKSLLEEFKTSDYYNYCEQYRKFYPTNRKIAVEIIEQTIEEYMEKDYENNNEINNKLQFKLDNYYNQYVYENNIDLFIDYMNSNFYKECKKRDGNNYFNKLIMDKIYTDPDWCDKKLYKKMEELYKQEAGISFKDKCYYDLKLNGGNITLSFDGQVGWKCLYDLYTDQKDEKDKYIFLEKYKAIRGSKYGQVLWPKHTLPTINTLRNVVFGDRIDYTLYDIKNFYDAIKGVEGDKNKCIKAFSQKCRLATAYQKDDTLNWLLGFETFENFIDTMNLAVFVVRDIQKNDGKESYQVIDLEKGNKEFVENYENCAITEAYINNLINLIQGFPLKENKSESDNN